jgi:hypothetical protein
MAEVFADETEAGQTLPSPGLSERGDSGICDADCSII